MRGNRAVIIFMTASLVAAAPAGAFAQSAEFGRPAQMSPAGHGADPSHEDAVGSGLDASLQHILVGTAVLGGAFTLGLVATGSLSTAMGAAAAVVITYAVLP